jgi:hypothetical protein
MTIYVPHGIVLCADMTIYVPRLNVFCTKCLFSSSNCLDCNLCRNGSLYTVA